jgi:hypothetical protein
MGSAQVMRHLRGSGISIGMFVFVAMAAPAVPSAQAAAPAATLGKVSGGCTFDKKRAVKFVDGVALSGQSFLDDKKPVTLVRVSTLPLGAFRPDLFVDPSVELDGMSSGPVKAYNIITLELDMSGSIQGLGPSGSFRTGWTSTGGILKNGRISGTVNGTGGARDEDACQITFDVPLVGDYGAGKPLPSDGGEPGKAMRALWASLKNEDSAATIAVLGESLVAAAQHGTMPQFAIVFGNGGGNQVVGGKLYGTERAILDLNIEPGMKGHALVLKQGDRWRVQDVSFN